MAYRFNLSNPVPDEVQRLVLEQIDRATRELSRPHGEHANVHQARKSLKRARAALRLARHLLGKPAFRSANRRLRDVARGLSGARDKQAMIEAVIKLQVRFGADWNPPAVAAVKSWLYEERRRAERHLANGSRGTALVGLGEARALVSGMALEGTVATLMQGLEDGYRRGCKTFGRTHRAAADDEDFHECRKWVQQHWRHMQLLRNVWPEAAAARVGTARALSQLLGDKHDLHVLIERIDARPELRGDDPDIMVFLAGCEHRRRELRAAARPLGQRLYVERPKAFRQRLAAYWRSARGAVAVEAEPFDDVAQASDMLTLQAPLIR